MFYFIKEGLLKCGLYLQGCLYSEVAFHTVLTVYGSEIFQFWNGSGTICINFGVLASSCVQFLKTTQIK